MKSVSIKTKLFKLIIKKFQDKLITIGPFPGELVSCYLHVLIKVLQGRLSLTDHTQVKLIYIKLNVTTEE